MSNPSLADILFEELERASKLFESRKVEYEAAQYQVKETQSRILHTVKRLFEAVDMDVDITVRSHRKSKP